MARGRKSSSLTTIAFIAFIGYVIYTKSGFFDTPIHPEIPDDKVTKVTPDLSAYSMLTTLNSWPQITTDNIPYTESTDLLSKNYYLVLDASGSMEKAKCSGSKSKMDVAFNALDGFIQSLPEDANFGLAIFHKSQLKELVPLGQPQDRKNIVFSIRHKFLPNGSTPLADAMTFAYRKLSLHGSRQLGYGEYNLVLITDGIADDGQDPGKIIQDITQQSPIVINIIGFCISDRHSLNQPGRTIYYSANDPKSLSQGLQEVLAESPEFNVSDFSR